jgi:PAS domain S-box-containing protein
VIDDENGEATGRSAAQYGSNQRGSGVLVPPLGLNVVQIGGNVAIGIVGAVLWTVRPVALPLLLVPLVLSYFACRAWFHGRRERDTMHHLFAETMEQRRKLEEIIAHVSNGIFVVDPDGSIVSWNHAMETMTGFSSNEAVGQPCAEILGSDWLLDGEVAGSGAASLDGGAEERHVPLVTKDRVGRWIRYTAKRIVDHDGRTTASVVVARDVTEELEAERVKADFVATVSHELRTPLTPLKGFLSALLQGTLDDSPDDRCEYYRIMMNQAERLERLITDLLEVSRMESMDPSITSDVVELSGLVADQIDELGKSQQGRRIVFHGPGVPILVLADPFRLGQVVSNLVSNAVKYSPPDSDIDVSVDREEDNAVVSVRDQGDGIPLSEHERVFERFQRLGDGLSRKTGGTGLGLYIAKRFVEAMSGRMWLTSAPGKGSTFSFSVPLAPPTRLGQAADGADELAAAASAS